MKAPEREYLSGLARRLHLASPVEREILTELATHIDEKAGELMARGIASDVAWARAVDEFGCPTRIADRLYEVHSRGSWYHTALAIIPHVLLALMFALHLWSEPVWIAVMLTGAAVISVVGWRKGRPRWTYPWLGYCLVVPILSWGLAMSAVGYGAWGVLTRGSLPLGVPIYAASLAYFAFSLWIVIRVVSRAARPDWVMASLAVLPVPFLAYWFFFFHTREEALRSVGQSLREFDSSAAVIFLILAVATAVFFRIGRRLVRVALVVITAPSMIVLAWLSYQGGPGYVVVFTFSALSLALLLSPALFDLKDGAQYEAFPAERTPTRSAT